MILRLSHHALASYTHSMCAHALAVSLFVAVSDKEDGAECAECAE